MLEKDKLVKKGYARVYYVYGKYKYTNKLRASEKVAKRKKLGVWKNYKAAFPDSKSSSNKNTTTKKFLIQRRIAVNRHLLPLMCGFHAQEVNTILDLRAVI